MALGTSAERIVFKSMEGYPRHGHRLGLKAGEPAWIGDADAKFVETHGSPAKAPSSFPEDGDPED